MHELSIARALIDLTRKHAAGQSGGVLRVDVQVGPLQAIDGEAMRFAWQAATMGTELAGASLMLDYLPWRLLCPECGLQWEAESFTESCRCGNSRPVPQGGDELLLVSLEVQTKAQSNN
jgi:hydrogenase nickel incorporation protein HypA/HybF